MYAIRSYYDIDLSSLPESTFDGIGITRAAKLFALPGGMLETAGYSQKHLNAAYVHTSGAENVKMILDAAVSRITSYNVCYTKLLRLRKLRIWASL